LISNIHFVNIEIAKNDLVWNAPIVYFSRASRCDVQMVKMAILLKTKFAVLTEKQIEVVP